MCVPLCTSVRAGLASGPKGKFKLPIVVHCFGAADAAARQRVVRTLFTHGMHLSTLDPMSSQQSPGNHSQGLEEARCCRRAHRQARHSPGPAQDNPVVLGARLRFQGPLDPLSTIPPCFLCILRTPIALTKTFGKGTRLPCSLCLPGTPIITHRRRKASCALALVIRMQEQKVVDQPPAVSSCFSLFGCARPCAAQKASAE